MQTKSVQGFKVVSIRFSDKYPAEHELFVKEHSVRNQPEDKPAGRTLFVLNVPPFATEDSFKRIFSSAGSVENVIFQAKPDNNDPEPNRTIFGFKVAYIVYKKPDSIEKALNLTALKPISTPDNKVITGMQKWIMEYNRNIYDHTVLDQNVTKFMDKYDKEERKLKAAKNQKDDEGWTLVTSKGRNPAMKRKESVENKLLEKLNKGAKRKERDDFYTFQRREKRMLNLALLRRQYEEDKKKLQAMKAARKFKPF